MVIQQIHGQESWLIMVEKRSFTSLLWDLCRSRVPGSCLSLAKAASHNLQGMTYPLTGFDTNSTRCPWERWGNGELTMVRSGLVQPVGCNHGSIPDSQMRMMKSCFSKVYQILTSLRCWYHCTSTYLKLTVRSFPSDNANRSLPGLLSSFGGSKNG